MKQTGIIRQIDKLGRVVIPADIRKKLNLEVGTNVEVFINDDEVILKKHKFYGCQLCGEAEEKKIVQQFGLRLCKKCIVELGKKANEN